MRFLIFVLVVLASPVTLQAQQEGPPAAPDRRHHGPVEKLIRHREVLELTDEQVAQIQEIGARMEERNRPFVARLLEIRREMRSQIPAGAQDSSSERREAFKRGLEKARPIMQEIRKNNDEAMREVGAVLTVEQRTKLRDLIEQGRKRRGERSGGKPWRHERPF